MQMLIFLSMIIFCIFYLHIRLPGKIASTGHFTKRRILFDILFLETTVFTVLLLLKPDAFGKVNYLLLLQQGEIASLLTNVFLAYIILLLYCLPILFVMYLSYRFYILKKQWSMDEVDEIV